MHKILLLEVLQKTGDEGTVALTDLLSPMAKYQQSIKDVGDSLEQVGAKFYEKI